MTEEHNRRMGQFQLKYTLSFSSLNGRRAIIQRGTILEGLYEDDKDSVIVQDQLYGKVLVRKQSIEAI